MSAKPKVIRFQPPVPDDDEGEDCPKCPPPGAPAWLATFADIATNLMAFFVLILGFAKFDEPSFSKMAGAMRETFGFHSIRDSTSGNTMIDFGLPTADPDGAQPDETSDAGGPEDGGDAPERVAEALKKALEEGRLQVRSDEGEVVIELSGADGRQQAQSLARALAETAGLGPLPELQTTSQPRPEPKAGPAGPGEGTGAPPGPPVGGGTGAALRQSVRAELDALRLRNALDREVADGLVKVEQTDGKVFVSLGAGGSFPSGSDELTPDARAVMARIAEATRNPERTITVTGHTDNVPVAGGAFRDNIALAAGRAASVVRELVASGSIDPGRITAVSRGEFDPVADNATEEGRAQNRRIEIEISYKD
ncbi:OmpA family protein [Cereibacter sphaeroides]|uniref:OmpA family protein n=1 Tax=Cereibacter johrii TaxID=445629 RepID=UPI000E1DF736|nr:flagellar motor protein MotB [Cereibacter sphaeroides f. sp. denitrificans]